jgi:EAL domain-containing protein (putative c-di-GMP-specific phosphodiesterase class I)
MRGDRVRVSQTTKAAAMIVAAVALIFGAAGSLLAIIRAIMELGSSLGMITTAEGVETEQQLEILRDEGCMQVQGFLYSKAVPAAEIPPLLHRLRPRIKAA